MHVFKNDKFEIGMNLEGTDTKGIRDLFQVMRDCEECSQYPAEIDQLESEVWMKYEEINK